MATMSNKYEIIKHLLNICKIRNYFDITFINEQIKGIKYLNNGKLLYGNIKNKILTHEKSLKCNEDDQNIINDLENFIENPSVLINKNKHRLEMIKNSKNFLEIIKFNKPNEIYIKNDLVNINHGNLLLKYYILNNNNEHFFNQIKYDHKFFLLNLIINPKRLNLTEEMINNYSTKTIQILSNFSFGNILLENLQLFNWNDKKVLLSSKFLDNIALNTIFDGIDSADNNIICLNNQLSPYQCGLLLNYDRNVISDKTLNDLNDLGNYIKLLLNNSNIKVFNSNNQQPINDHITEIDEIGIPYIIIINETSLINGLIKLRNRDTTISEIIHLTDVQNYLLKLFV